MSTAERRAPVQGDTGAARTDRTPAGERLRRGSGTITWTEHVSIWEAYALRFGCDQSAERIAERGGFGYAEIVFLTGMPPTTWRPR